MLPIDGPPNVAAEIRKRLAKAKVILDDARSHGDELHIDLAENALNNLLDEYWTAITEL